MPRTFLVASVAFSAGIVLGLVWGRAFWYETSVRSDQERPSAFTRSPGPAQLRPPVSGSHKAANEAVDALEGLVSVTNAGIGYMDYAPRVLDAKVIVDRYLANQGASDKIAGRPMRRAMDLFVLGSTVWNASLGSSSSSSYERGAFMDRNARAAIEACPAVAPAWRDFLKGTAQGDYDGEKARWTLPFLWKCASEGVVEARRALGAGG